MPWIPEMRQEMIYGSFLILCQILIRILDLLEIGDIPEEPAGIYKVLVYIVKITEHHISPEHELIQGFGLGIKVPVASVQFQKQVQLIRCVDIVYLIEEIVDGIHFRRHQRPFPNQAPKVFSEKHQGTAVREDKAAVLYLTALIVVPGHLPEEWIHYYLIA